jgi:phosphatidylglycerophosphate synthase
VSKRNYYLVNAITTYRLLASPILVILVFTNHYDLFKWMLAISFATDAIDGFLARRLKVMSKLGSKLDSVADDFTIIAATVGVFVFKHDFIMEQIVPIGIMFVLFVIENGASLIKYRHASVFHTYLAKFAAVFQGSFLILIFFMDKPSYLLFWASVVITCLDLLEEIILVFVLAKSEANVKGLWWVLKKKKQARDSR